jgi:hypothetical protein
MDAITAAVAWVRQNTNLNYDESINTVMSAAESYADLKDCDWQSLVEQVAYASQQAQLVSPGPADAV